MQGKLKISFSVLFIFICAITFAQAPNFIARADAKQVLQNSMINIEYKLENAEGSNFQAPDFKPFKQVGGPSTQTSMTIVNGKMAKSMTYSFRLLAPEKGKFVVGPASMKVGNKSIKSNSVQIEVLEASAKTNKSEEDFYVELIASSEDVFVGQQIYIDYVLFTTKEVRSFNPIDESSYDGFFSVNATYRAPTERIVKDGKEYFTKTMMRKILYPQQTGTYTIDPTNIELGVLDDNSRRRGFIFSSSLRPVNVLTNGLTLRVRNLPPSTNPAFANAVGKYTMKSSINKNRVTTDDAITINMEVNGNGDPKLVTAPNFINPNDFDIYDPNITLDEWDRDKKRHRKIFEYLIVPKKKGIYSIQPEFEYFDVDSNKYISLKSRTTRITVSQGTGNKDAALLEQKEIAELSPIRTATNFASKSGTFYQSLPYWLLLSLGFLSMLVTGAMHFRRVKSGALDPELIRKEKARRVAMEKLETAKGFMDQGNGPKFYEEIIRAQKEYLADKYSIPATYLKKSSIESSLKQKSVDDSTIQKLVDLFNTCELNLYAGGKAESMQESYSDAKVIIELLES